MTYHNKPSPKPYHCDWCGDHVDECHCAWAKGTILIATEFTRANCEECRKKFEPGDVVVFKSLNQLGGLWCEDCS